MFQKAAVLIPIYLDNSNDLRLILVRRAEGGVYGGQLAFPGGLHNAKDASMLDTALRETEEEIGLSTDKIKIVKEFPVVETKSTGFRIYPFLAKISPLSKWICQEKEIAEVLDIRLADLVQPEAQGETVEYFSAWEGPRKIRFYKIGAHRLWGVTFRILNPHIQFLLNGHWG